MIDSTNIVILTCCLRRGVHKQQFLGIKLMATCIGMAKIVCR